AVEANARRALLHPLEEPLAPRGSAVARCGGNRLQRSVRRQPGVHAAAVGLIGLDRRTPGDARHVVGTRDAVDESLARKQRRRIDPGLAAGPTLDVGWREQVLAHPSR